MKEINLSPKDPFTFSETLWFLDRNLDDCMHTVMEDKVLKAVRTSRGAVLFSVGDSPDGPVIKRLAGAEGSAEEITRFVTEWFDLERDIKPFYRLLTRDKELAFLKKKYRGFHVVGIPDLFECLVWCIAGQQINLTFAYTLKRRFVERWGDNLLYRGKKYYLFPTPEKIAEISISELREMQFTTRKAEYITGIAKAFAEKKLDKEILKNQGTEEQMLAYLMSFRGIGQWTANYVLMKSMGAMNRIPLGDAGVNQALLRHKGIPRSGDEVVKKVFAPFEDWKTYLVFYLWRSLRDMA